MKKGIDLEMIKKMCALFSTSAEYLQYTEKDLIAGFTNNFKHENTYDLQLRKGRRILDKSLDTKIKQMKLETVSLIKMLKRLEDNFTYAMKDTEGEIIENYISSIHNALEGLETRSGLQSVVSCYKAVQANAKRKNKMLDLILLDLDNLLK